MGDFHPAEPDMVARDESVDVKALADANVGGLMEQPRLGLGEVLRGGDLHIAGLALEYMRTVAGPFGDRRIVGEALHAAARGGEMRGQNEIEAKALRRLYGAQSRARWGCDDEAGRIHLLDRVGEPGSRRGRAILLGGRDGAPNEDGRGKSARPVMD